MKMTERIGKRVVITGLGALTPIGNSVEAYWQALQNAKSGAAPISRFDTTAFKTKFACELKNFDPLDYFDRKEARQIDPYAQYGLIAADEAISHAGLTASDIDKDRVGVIWASGIGGLTTFQREISSYALSNGNPRFNPFFVPKMIANMASGLISMKYRYHGVNFATVSACAASTNALIDACNYIRLGKADVIVAGGSEAAIVESGVGGFNAMKALSTRNDDPETASRPFDKNRDGFVLGEGAGALILESLNHAIRRGATIYAELGGGGTAADAYHMTATHPEGKGAFLAMKAALEDAAIKVKDVDYINLHATSTGIGDPSELAAIKMLFKEKIANVKLSATKSMTGHLLGAAGAIEAIACIQAIRYGSIPPTINNELLDECVPGNVDLTLNTAAKAKVDVAMSNTFGFGGHAAAVVLRRFED